MRINYTALRRVTSGHTAGQNYNLDFFAQQLVPSLAPQRTRQRGNEGDEEVQLFYIDETWQVTTDHMSAATKEEFLEFFASCIGGESFTFDPDRNPGDVADGDPRAAVLVGTNPGLRRVDPNLNVWQASFSLRNEGVIL